MQSLVKQLLGVPREIEFYDMMALGYPDMEPKPRIVRVREDMVHYDGYDQGKIKLSKR